jgi:methionyl-tRNA formyltransferase
VVNLRVVFFGTPAFAVPTLQRLISSRHQVVAVVTQPDRPRGRGQHTAFSPVKDVAIAVGVPVLQPERLKVAEFVDPFRALAPDLAVVAAYGRIIPQLVLDIPKHGMINVHASILPKYRGAAPVHRAVIAGDTETGVSLMQLVFDLDAGPVFDVVRTPIGPEETSREVEARLAQLGAELCVKVVDEIAEGRATAVPQDGSQATYAPRITTAEGPIDWTLPARVIHNRVRGLHPWPHASSSISGSRVLILRTTVDEAVVPPQTAPGTVLRASGDQLIVSTGEGALQILQLQPEGRRLMTAREFLAGRRIPPGVRFA